MFCQQLYSTQRKNLELLREANQKQTAADNLEKSHRISKTPYLSHPIN
jgi:hypothetical protein